MECPPFISQDTRDLPVQAIAVFASRDTNWGKSFFSVLPVSYKSFLHCKELPSTSKFNPCLLSLPVSEVKCDIRMFRKFFSSLKFPVRKLLLFSLCLFSSKTGERRVLSVNKTIINNNTEILTSIKEDWTSYKLQQLVHCI